MSDQIGRYKSDLGAFSQLLLVNLHGEGAMEIIERGDGFIDSPGSSYVAVIEK